MRSPRLGETSPHRKEQTEGQVERRTAQGQTTVRQMEPSFVRSGSFCLGRPMAAPQLDRTEDQVLPA